MFKFAVASACCLAAVEGKGFLSGQGVIQIEELENALMRELPGAGNRKRLAVIQAELRPMYVTLPKNKLGRLEPPSVRYALHRYFVHKHGWHVKGLDPEGGSWNSTSHTLTKEWAPVYIQQIFEKRFHGRGLDLEELASFAATLSDLIFGEGITALEAIYKALKFPLDRPVPMRQFDLAIRGYIASIIVDDPIAITTRADILSLEEEAASTDTSYPDIVLWLKDTRLSWLWRERTQVNPFLASGVSFEFAAEFMKDLLHNFGSVSTAECTTLKSKLVDMEEANNGRVKLGDFYAGDGLQIRQSVDYLRNQGVLEEGNGGARIVIPNYVMSPCRCLPFSGYFSVCCGNECEDLIGSVERAVGALSATPLALAGIISKLPSSTVIAPRNLSEALVGRLEEIAELHHGQVPLHGRLFGQWLHHAFPRECSYPHVSGTVKAISQVDWLEQNDDVHNVLATEEEREEHIAKAKREVEASIDALPWISVEELVAADHFGEGKAGAKAHSWSWLRLVMGVVLCLSFVAPLAKTSRKVMQDGSSSKTQSHLV